MTFRRTRSWRKVGDNESRAEELPPPPKKPKGPIIRERKSKEQESI
jgi:hypothetical protein